MLIGSSVGVSISTHRCENWRQINTETFQLRGAGSTTLRETIRHDAATPKRKILISWIVVPAQLTTDAIDDVAVADRASLASCGYLLPSSRRC